MKAWWYKEENYHPGQFYMRDVRRLERIPHVTAVAPVVSLPRVDVFYRNNEWSPRLAGVDQEYWKTQTPHIKKGRLISASDVVGRKTVCVLGRDVVEYLFGGEDPVGKVVRVGNLTFEVIGVLGGIQHGYIKRSVFIPIRTAQNLFMGLYKIQEIYIRTDDWNKVEWVRKQALALLRASHPGYEKGIEVTWYPGRVERVKSTIGMIKLFIYGTLIVTLVLGGLGITNIMLAVIQDRTQEIGLRKALGAGGKTILVQFLTESVLISLISGVIGSLWGSFVIFVLHRYLGITVSEEVLSLSIVVALIFTFILGVLSGLYPSYRAARLDPVSAMRFE